VGSPAIVGNDVWASIALVLQRNSKIIIQDSNSLNPVLNKFDPDEGNLSPAFLKMYNDKGISFDEVKQFVQSVWVLNSKFIEVLGYHAKDSVYLEEQNHLQHHMFNVLNKPQNHAELIERSKDLSENDTEKQERVVSDIIFSSLMCKETARRHKPTFETPKRVSKQDLKMAEAAVKMIGHHYLKKNIAKWFNLFKDENGFINAFMNVGNRKSYRETHNSFNIVTSKTIRNMKLLPWKDTMYTTSLERDTDIRSIRRKRRFH
jgi:hypothetical protein